MPIPPDPSVLVTEMLDHLVTVGLVRRPSTSSPAELPKMYVEPKNGVPAPAEVDAEATIGAWRRRGVPSRPFESSLRKPSVEFLIRTLRPVHAEEIHAGLRAELIDRRHWQMGSWTISASDELRDLDYRGSDDDGYSHDFAVLFTTYA
jgi:hypothetical protein